MNDTDLYTELTKMERFSIDHNMGRDYACGVFKQLLISVFNALNTKEQDILIKTLQNLNQESSTC